MTKRVTITCAVAIAMLQAAAPARATIGSVISSFPIDPTSTYGIYREGSYVYLSQNQNNNNYLRTYTLSGGYLRRLQLINGNPAPLYGGSRTHLGAGYVALCDISARYLKIFSIARGGSPVASFSTGIAPTNCFWDSEYFYVNHYNDKGVFRRFTSSGSSAGTWTCAGWPAGTRYCHGATYAQRGNYGAGPYFVASSGEFGRPCCMTTFPGGSLVRTWGGPRYAVKHLAYGDSSKPGVYGAAIWAIQIVPNQVIEIDIDARGASGVIPASLGKVKAIYR